MLDKKSRNILILFGIALLAIIVIELTRPTPINWKSSYTSSDKIPFGGYVLFEELNELKNDKELNIISKNPYDFLSEAQYAGNSAYLFINSSIDFDKRSYEKLIEYIRQGNSAFISGGYFGQIFKDSLNIDTKTDYDLTETEITPTFFSTSLKENVLPKFKKKIYKTIFKSFDTTKTTVLGYYQNEELEKLEEVNFIKIKEGKGYLYLNTLPQAFSNYYMLNGNHQYAATCLSFLNNPKEIYWDDYLKDGRKIIDSPMRFVLGQTSLRWAYYLLALGLLVFIIFSAKREQRMIPVVTPLENTSIEFTKTISNLYFQHKDYSDIVSKKITYFLERIRSTHYINTNTLDTKFIERLATKTNHSVDQTKDLVDCINALKNKTMHSEADLTTLHKKIEEFTI